MRFMMIVKANKDSEAGKLPPDELIAAMGEVQRRAHQGRCPRRSRRTPVQRQRCPRPLLHRRQAHRHRRPVRRNQGTHRRLLGHQRQFSPGSHRMGQACSRSPRSRPGMRTRTPAVLRTGRFSAQRRRRPPQAAWRTISRQQKKHRRLTAVAQPFLFTLRASEGAVHSIYLQGLKI